MDIYVFVILALVSFVALLFSARTFLVDFRDMGLSMYSGVRGSIHEVSAFVSRTVNAAREIAGTKQENTELRARVARYEELERSAADIRRENERLREQLGFAEMVKYRYKAAEITGHDPSNLFSPFVINKGKKHGVSANMPVVAYQNGMETLVGKVAQATQFESLVMPLYDPGSHVAARLAESRFEGIVDGEGAPDSPLLMRFVRGNRLAAGELSVGELVVSSGLGGVYPPGISLGRVSRVLSHGGDGSVELEITGIADYSRLEYVFVIDAQSYGR